MVVLSSVFQYLKILLSHWWRYQRDQYPLWKALPLAGAMSVAAVRYPALVAGREPPSLWVYLVAFILLLLLRLQRCIVEDVSRDYPDHLHLPNRPTPRGVATTNELRALFLACLPVQILLCFFLEEPLLKPLFFVIIYLMILTIGMGPLRWNAEKPWPFLILHRSGAPLTLFLAAACEWIPRQGTPPLSLIFLLLISFAISFVHDIGRHFDLSRNHHPDARSFATVWGSRRSVLIWWMLINATAILSSLARWRVGGSEKGLFILLSGILITGGFAYQYAANPKQIVDRRFEILSVLWSVSMFLTVVLF
ncbi:MAG: UbiA family prenyltransferase [Kiritimatiellae bacterium]|jgi:4-hydroxybenzoate polyprenyltransferase|nr:UbiA family prenyltransferase [Kiritimatiellia bacterium]